MEHLTGSDRPIVPQDPVQDGGFRTAEEVRALVGGLPRVFALVQGFEESNGEGAAKVVAYGLELPCGTAATVGVDQGFGRWRSARSAAARLDSDLVWLEEGGA
ncbi:hypothetical protein [Streptosporangium carneum]|uniref:Uncharacterized protein n=1 Tax=Streptosporangium carneum TaxID=47481 RepID=A0A9W6IAE7_9ACTN|nr:hypothetical protein [Streptosporangium carneum]GLK15047.1 hypothetical protein GCM10017600_84600 [Streptosporangium carneum]